jgi:hypothetical protein
VTRSMRVLALGVLAALALVACGETEGIAGPQKEQAQEADAICEQTQGQVGRLADDAARDRDAVRSAADRLRAMDYPSENETVWLRFVTESENLWLALQDVAEAREPGVNEQARANRAVTRVRETNDRVKELARDYGMEACAEGFGTNP